MITAGASVDPRTRSSAGPLRLLWLALLLFGFLYTHAAGADSASAHALGGPVTPPSLTDGGPRTGDATPPPAGGGPHGDGGPLRPTAAEPHTGHGYGRAQAGPAGSPERPGPGDRAAVPAPGGHGDGGGHSHPAEACDAGHTQHGGELSPPGRAPLGEPASPGSGAATRTAGGDRALPPLRSSVGSVVRRV
ncbi:hypothetical protein ACIQUQ_33925 [Streptomyces sp. NPDC101118]|uniref:hypothetical protein n=1 Tax=Streptomyces sp. NPDC101118 TaxID=3366109 RepID=UPI0037FC15FA